MADAVLGDSTAFMSGQDIYENFSQAKGPGALMDTQSALAEVMEKYNDRSKQIIALAGSMEGGWTGDASQAAQRSAGPLAVAHANAAEAMTNASQLIQNQAQAFYDTKNKVVPVPEVPSAPSTMETIFTLGSAKSRYEDKVNAANQAARQNVAAMDTWTGTSSSNGSGMPTTYGKVDPRTLGVIMASSAAAPPSVGGPTGPVPHANGGQGQVTHGGGAAVPVPAGGGYRVPAGQVPRTTGTSGSSTAPTQFTTPGGYQGVPGGGAGGSGTTGSGGWQQGGATSGSPGLDYLPAGSLSGSLDGSTTGYRGSGSGSLSGGGAGSGGGADAGSGRASGRLHGGAPGTGSEKELGAGNRVGAGSPGAAGEPVARGGPAAPTGKGAGTGAMGGAHGGKGKGGEDEEHQRKYVLAEDEHFQLVAAGEKFVDPNTGMPVAPPVIGQ